MLGLFGLVSHFGFQQAVEKQRNMLRQAQHERILLIILNVYSVRPELVEGLRISFSTLSSFELLPFSLHHVRSLLFLSTSISSAATNDVQPVWWPAPRPIPVSPLKYSWNGM